MNEQEYRRAVKQFRWSDTKRKAIEEILSKPFAASEAANDWPESAEHYKVVVTHDSAKRTEAIEMKQHKSRKLLLLGLAAAVIATGGAVAAVAGNFRGKTKTLDITHENGTVLHLTDEEATHYYLNYGSITSSMYYYEDPKSMVTPVENGCFYYQESVDQGKENYVLMYTDYATGQSVPVCAKPNCKHDGNAYCTASSNVYAPSHLEHHDGYLYSLTTKFLHPENRSMDETDLLVPELGSLTLGYDIDEHANFEKPENCRQVLLRYSPDGTQIEELHDFGNGKGISRCQYHRGYIWCLVQLQTSGENNVNAITGDYSNFTNGGWQIWGYELATGKTVCLYDAIPAPDKNHVNPMPTAFMVSGDYIYFSRHSLDWSGSTSSLIRLSLLTGKEETVVSSDEYFGAGGVSPKKVFCQGETRRVKGVDIQTYYVLNLESGEKSEAKSVFKTPQGEQGFTYFGIAFMDDQFIYVDKEFVKKPVDSDSDTDVSKIYLFDDDLNTAKVIDNTIGTIDINTPDGYNILGINGAEIACEYQGYFYIKDFTLRFNNPAFSNSSGAGKNDYAIKRVPVSDLLNGGEAHYETVCSYEY